MASSRNMSVPPDLPTRRRILIGAGIALGSLALGQSQLYADSSDGISEAAESIHQEPFFKASRQRIYVALTDASQFHKASMLSEAMRSGMAPGMKPTQISRDEGGAFQLFGGYITGRHVELVPNERVVQAWRAGSWDPGIYSIVRFELSAEGSGTRLVFDHTGFPKGQAEHLASGWKSNYWKPLERFLA